MNVSETDSSITLYNSLLDLCLDNKQFFHNLNDTKSQKLYSAFVTLEEQIENLLPLLNDFRIVASTYDFKSVQANGYRSFIAAVDKLSGISKKICQNVCDNRNSLFFQRLHYVKYVFIVSPNITKSILHHYCSIRLFIFQRD